MTEEYKYYTGRLPRRIYVSRAFGPTREHPTAPRQRIVRQVFDAEERQSFANVKGEVVIRITEGERQELKAVFYEDDRRTQQLTIQKFNVKNGTPVRQAFNFTGREIESLQRFLRAIKHIGLEDNEGVRYEEDVLEDLISSLGGRRKFLLQHIDLVREIIRQDVTVADVAVLAQRKEQLDLFRQLLEDEEYFQEKRAAWGKRGPEDVWQHFFESNPWLFGYGLSFVFNAPLDEERLEQVTSGHTFFQSGKRVDALMRSRGILSSLCFVEIKTHRTDLLAPVRTPYRPDCWAASSELAGAIAQVQKTTMRAMIDIRGKLDLRDDTGNPLGDSVFAYSPKSFVVIGSLREFLTANGPNESKLSSFELLRRSLHGPEIITFDELYERARFIVENSEASYTQ